MSRKRGSTSSRVAGSRQRPSRRGVGAQQPAIAIDDQVESDSPSPSGAGPSDAIHHHAAAIAVTVTMR